MIDHLVLKRGHRGPLSGRGPDKPPPRPEKRVPHVELSEAARASTYRCGTGGTSMGQTIPLVVEVQQVPWGEDSTGATLVAMYLACTGRTRCYLARSTGQDRHAGPSLALPARRGGHGQIKPQYPPQHGRAWSPFRAEVGPAHRC